MVKWIVYQYLICMPHDHAQRVQYIFTELLTKCNDDRIDDEQSLVVWKIETEFLSLVGPKTLKLVGSCG